MTNIKLQFKVQEPASFFHILDSVSDWDIHTRRVLRDYYKENVGLSATDQKHLKKYVLLRRKYSWGFLDSDFIRARNFSEARQNLRKRLNAREYKEMVSIINNFRPLIHRIYLEHKPLLTLRKEVLERESKKIKLGVILGEIKSFYDSSYSPRTIYVHLLVNIGENKAGGGANIHPKRHITIEPLNATKNDIGAPKGKLLYSANNSLRVIIHESLHLIESQASKKKWRDFEEKTEELGLNFDVLREAIAHALAPDGILTENFSKSAHSIREFKNLKIPSNTPKREKHYMIMRKLSAQIYPLTENQIKNGLSIFEGKFTNDCINIYGNLQEHIQKK